MLQRSGLASLIDSVVDGRTIRAKSLEAKPAPDTLITACQLLGIGVDEAASFDTTVEGVDTARTAGVAVIVGVDRDGRLASFSEHCGGRLVSGLAELLDRQAYPLDAS